jgi:uncharacterized protein (DUF885 family)
MKLQMGSAFDLKTFHNRFLSFGYAPVPAIIDLMAENASR